MVFGLIPVGEELKPLPKLPSKADRALASIAGPAKYILWISTPIALIAFALTLAIQCPVIQKQTGTVIQCPVIQKQTGTVSVAAGLVSAGATAIIVATAYWWLLVLFLIIGGVTVMIKYKDRGILLKAR